MGTNDLTDLKVEEATLRRKLESTRDLSERRQIRALLRTLKEKREQHEQLVADDRINNNDPVSAVKPPGTSRDVKDGAPGVRFANVDKPLEKTDSGTNILELRSRRRSLAKPPPSTSFLVNKLSNVMQREKAAHASSTARGVHAFKNKFENKDANNNQGGVRPGYGSPVTKKSMETRSVVSQQTSKAVVETKSVQYVEKKEEPEIHHPNRNALRSRRRSVAKLQVNKHAVEKPSAPMQNGPIVKEPEAPTAKDARFQRRLSRTRMTPKVDSSSGRFTPMGQAGVVKPNAFGTPAERMAYFQQASQQEKLAETKPEQPAKPVQPAPKPAAAPAQAPQQQNKENDDKNKPVEKIPRRSPPKKKPQLKRQMSVSQLVLQWCQEQTQAYEGVNITNFSASFADGLAMAALIHKFNPDLFDFNSLKPGDKERNFTTAFQAAEKVGVAVLLDVEDLVRMKKPEPRSIQTQVQMIFSKYRPKDLDTSQLTIA